MSEGRILVVEDDADVANLLRFLFESQGYQVSVAPTGLRALDLCCSELPHAVILDIQLPEMDGYQVCRRLRENLRTSHIPILFLTQRDERSDRIAGLELGADDYITKPFDIDELKLRVQNAIKRARWENLTSPTTGLPSGKLIEEHGTGEVLKAMADHHFEDLSESERNMAMSIEALAERITDKEKGDREWREFQLCM